MKFVEITYSNGDLAYISPVPRSRVTALGILLRQLYDRWISRELSTSDLLNDYGSWQLMLRIANFFPRIDLPEQVGFDVEALKDDPDQLEALYLAQTEHGDGEGELKPAKLVELSCFEPIELPLWRQDDDVDPIPSSGDADMDLLAMLSASTTAQDAAFVMDRLTTEQMDRYLFYLAEIRRDPEERQQENLAEDYLAWKSENEDLVRETLGIKFNFPTAEDVSKVVVTNDALATP